MTGMKRFSVLLILFCLFLTACGNGSVSTEPQATPTAAPVESVDYAASLKLDMTTDTAKQEVTVKSFIDGDTVHFNVRLKALGTGAGCCHSFCSVCSFCTFLAYGCCCGGVYEAVS